MNKRIKELAIEADKDVGEDISFEFCKKFATLLVEDVLQIIATSDAKCQDEWDCAERDLYAEIQKHFGIK